MVAKCLDAGARLILDPAFCTEAMDASILVPARSSEVKAATGALSNAPWGLLALRTEARRVLDFIAVQVEFVTLAGDPGWSRVQPPSRMVNSEALLLPLKAMARLGQRDQLVLPSLRHTPQSSLALDDDYHHVFSLLALCLPIVNQASHRRTSNVKRA